ncbi:MAG: histidine phosphatase family protein [Proteobacteria bacterium]|nr:histidine phosphatase family protein [Pseudomonadota bacterium]
MHTLILLRHAKAEPEADSGLDFDRALTERGWAEARLIGRVLSDAGFRPDLVLASAAVRTVQTWEAASSSFPPGKAEALDSLYEASPEAILSEAVARGAKARVVAVVGHNPGIATLAAYLARESDAPEAGRISRSFPTAAAAVFRHDGKAVTGFEGFFPPGDTA